MGPVAHLPESLACGPADLIQLRLQPTPCWQAGSAAVSGRCGRWRRSGRRHITVNASHPDTHAPIVGTPIPDWDQATALVCFAAQALPGIRTQCPGTSRSPMAARCLLEVNFGGDLNLAQLAKGAGVLDETYAEHLRRNLYRL
jgi:Sugar-transfer associated ATP-grasp